ncbi:MAG: peptidylprolyl isomerase [Bacillota bacterium]
MNNNQVLAKVGDREITREDIEYLLKNLDPQTAAQFSSVDGVKQLISQLANQELFYLDALEKGIDKDEAYKNEVERLKASILKQYAINKYLNTASVDNNEALNYYNENKSDFKSPESVKASHILVKDENTAKEVLSEINSGSSFEDTVKKYSLCPSKSQGGDLGYFTKGKMVPEFESAAFSMKNGEISNEPVKTQFGFHIIKLTDKKDAGIKTFDEVKSEIHQQLIARKQEELYFNKVDELKSKYEVKMYI